MAEGLASEFDYIVKEQQEIQRCRSASNLSSRLKKSLNRFFKIKSRLVFLIVSFRLLDFSQILHFSFLMSKKSRSRFSKFRVTWTFLTVRGNLTRSYKFENCWCSQFYLFLGLYSITSRKASSTHLFHIIGKHELLMSFSKHFTDCMSFHQVFREMNE